MVLCKERGGPGDGQESAERRADLTSVAPGGEWAKGGRHLSRARGQRSDILRVEEKVQRPGAERTVRVATVAGRERQAQAAGGGPVTGPAHAAGDRAKKAIKPRQRRELGQWLRAVSAASSRRLSGLMM